MVMVWTITPSHHHMSPATVCIGVTRTGRAVAVLERYRERQSDTPPAGSLCSHGGRREVKMEVCPTAEYLDFRFISLSFSIFEKISLPILFSTNSKSLIKLEQKTNA